LGELRTIIGERYSAAEIFSIVEVIPQLSGARANGGSLLLEWSSPISWAQNWCDTDDLYIVSDNGFYDSRDPSMGLAITVAL
jgi:hypothetical protein